MINMILIMILINNDNTNNNHDNHDNDNHDNSHTTNDTNTDDSPAFPTAEPTRSAIIISNPGSGNSLYVYIHTIVILSYKFLRTFLYYTLRSLYVCVYIYIHSYIK